MQKQSPHYDITETILSTFQEWAEASRKADFKSMENLIVADSDFMDITKNCKKLSELGIKCFYEFSDLEIMGALDDTGQLMVGGEVRLLNSGSKVDYQGTFLSKCVREEAEGQDSSWKLGDIQFFWE